MTPTRLTRSWGEHWLLLEKESWLGQFAVREVSRNTSSHPTLVEYFHTGLVHVGISLSVLDATDDIKAPLSRGMF